MSTTMVPTISPDPSPTEVEGLFREHYQLIYRTAYSIAGTRQDAEDVLQTIFLRLLKREFPPDLKTHAKKYLYRSAVNAALTIVRTRQRERLAGDVGSLEIVSPETNTDRNEEIEQSLIDAMAQLPPQLLELVILRYEHNYSDAQIAKMLRKSRTSIAVSLYRARARLRKLLGATFGEKL
jgi:RNA polymerase sigma-70 factor (ECF subfamily)